MPAIKANKEAKNFEPQQFVKAPFRKLENGNFIIELPANFGSELGSNFEEVFLTMTSGILQVSTGEPQVCIPVLDLANDFGTPRC